ncbi:MAG: ribosome-associated translation inhibitor RaiA [candidate division WOR-3 bacterium]|nr:ribosome-associated translation inhibitor RaiA [candidate division WOR-3 bacterium]MCX7837324.1 ribosome-associated translation inhibitor RaiA [candidate division WOR-3 bacterium]MDW8114613.1 ribosome-associated translation inhibitor RaiA [candidate division WOR-3 bacterium]
MEINISARHFEVPEILFSLIEKKKRKFEKFKNLILDFHLSLSKDSLYFVSEGKIKLKTGIINAKVQNPELGLAVNETLNKLLTQLKKHHEKLIEKSAKKRG